VKVLVVLDVYKLILELMVVAGSALQIPNPFSRYEPSMTPLCE
jgi:hypothetical protein